VADGIEAAARRWIIYQHERFPLLAHTPLIAAFSFSAVSFSSLLRNDTTVPPYGALLVAFFTSLLFFVQLRIADEFKDFEEDSRFRPYRPVPRGLISLRELGTVFAIGAVIQLLLALTLDASLVVLMVITWIYLALMTREFFLRDYLKARPITYMWTHMLIMPLIDLYATACDWWVAGLRRPPTGLLWFLAVSFFNGVVIEIGRKIRAPEGEEAGVQTYTVLWGRAVAVQVWLGALTVTGLLAWMAGRQIEFSAPVAATLVMLLGAATIVAWHFVRNPTPARARLFEPMSALWTLMMYLSLGAVPIVFK
jgi:4-hydroxybenzoate polyprenyltransferase